MGRTMVMLMFILMSSFNLTYASAATVVKVYSGDTLDVENQGETLKIKLYGIDAPESGQDGNLSATRFLERSVLQSPIEIKVVETDVFGRNLAIVDQEGQKWSLNAIIVANGYAWVKPDECKIDLCSDLKKLESQARMLKLGIWSGFDLVPPWEFMKHQRN
jgi:micrococcal nuclease